MSSSISNASIYRRSASSGSRGHLKRQESKESLIGVWDTTINPPTTSPRWSD
ncbi:hypothetical protein CABS03_02209 [Colletotrichum abscissum]